MVVGGAWGGQCHRPSTPFAALYLLAEAAEILEGFLGLQIFTLNTQHDFKEVLAPFLDPLLGLWSTKQLM